MGCAVPPPNAAQAPLICVMARQKAQAHLQARALLTPALPPNAPQHDHSEEPANLAQAAQASAPSQARKRVAFRSVRQPDIAVDKRMIAK